MTSRAEANVSFDDVAVVASVLAPRRASLISVGCLNHRRVGKDCALWCFNCSAVLSMRRSTCSWHYTSSSFDIPALIRPVSRSVSYVSLTALGVQISSERLGRHDPGMVRYRDINTESATYSITVIIKDSPVFRWL